MKNEKYQSLFNKDENEKLIEFYRSTDNWYFIETLREIAQRYCEKHNAPITNVLTGYISDVHEHRRNITIKEFLEALEEYVYPYALLAKN